MNHIVAVRDDRIVSVTLSLISCCVCEIFCVVRCLGNFFEDSELDLEITRTTVVDELFVGDTSFNCLELGAVLYVYVRVVLLAVMAFN